MVLGRTILTQSLFVRSIVLKLDCVRVSETVGCINFLHMVFVGMPFNWIANNGNVYLQRCHYSFTYYRSRIFCPFFRLRKEYLVQWWIKDIPEGAPTNYLTNYSRKLHENNDILAPMAGMGGPASLTHPRPTAVACMTYQVFNYIFTDRVRSTRGGNIFSLSVHTWGGGVPHPAGGGGVPTFLGLDGGLPTFQGGTYLARSGWGVPPVARVGTHQPG